MTLILTTTCHYALLVAIEEGSGFPSLGDRDIFIQSRLSLHLPDTVGDLIPPSTIISAKPTKLIPNPQWRTTLVYFLSEKLLKRLRRQHAQVTLNVKTMGAEQGSMLELGIATLNVDQAKVIKMAREQQPLNILKNYVIDKGEWKPIRKVGLETTLTKCTTQIKAGLFIVDMPPPASERQRDVITPISRSLLQINKKTDDDLGLEIYSVDTSDSLITTNSSTRDIDDNNHNMTDQWINNTSTSDNYSTTVNKNVRIKQTLPSPSPSPSPPSSIVNCLGITRCKMDQTPYLQIGTGHQRYTFVFRIVEATAVTSLLLSSKNQQIMGTTRNSLQYTFSEWQIKNDVISNGNSWSVTDPPMRLSLQGHLHDLQQWISQQGQIEVCLVLVSGKCDHTIGKAMVRLKGWCPLTIEQASFPIHDRFNRLHVDQPFQFAKVVVQLGLISGWGDDDLVTIPTEHDNPLVQQQRRKESPFLYPNLIK